MAQDLLKANKDLAQQNRELFQAQGVKVVNLISSPGSGKTSLLETTLALLWGHCRMGVIEGDISTTRDAERIAGQGVPVVQINTGGLCHLDARMVERAAQELPLGDLDVVLIENVGNLVCPASFDLGEACKVVLLSVTEGSDKPAKYPKVFQQAQAVVISKVDLLPYTDFDLAGCLEELKQINPRLHVFTTSAKTQAGFSPWLAWLQNTEVP